MVEIFDRLYTRPLLGWRAVLRSAFLTSIITAIFVYEYRGNVYEVFSLEPYAELHVVGGGLLTNIASDYVSLFIVRRLLVVGGNRPLIALVGGPLVGMFVVFLFMVVRVLAIFPNYMEISPVGIAFAPSVVNFIGLLVLPALAVHLWLPLFGFGLLCVRGLNYLFLAIGGMQWFLKRGNDHPLDAVAYVLGAIAFVGTGILQLLR